MKETFRRTEATTVRQLQNLKKIFDLNEPASKSWVHKKAYCLGQIVHIFETLQSVSRFQMTFRTPKIPVFSAGLLKVIDSPERNGI